MEYPQSDKFLPRAKKVLPLLGKLIFCLPAFEIEQPNRQCYYSVSEQMNGYIVKDS